MMISVPRPSRTALLHRAPPPMSLLKPVRSPPVTKEGLVATFSVDTRQFATGDDVAEGALSRSDQFWTADEEKRLLRKLDLIITTLLFMGFFFLQLDRTNISNALTDTISADLGLSTDTLKAGTQLQTGSLCIFEIPSNIVLQRLGAGPWIVIQSFAWGLVATFQAFIQSKGSYFATRFLLGMTEAGYIPGAMYLMSTFFKRTEMAKRVALFYCGNNLAAAFGSIIAAGILSMGKTGGWGAWRYLFLIEGCLTLGAGCVLLALLPAGGPSDTRPWHKKFDFFTEYERSILVARKTQEREIPVVHFKLDRESMKKVGKGLLYWRVWSHGILNFLQLIPKGGLTFLSPKIVQTLGFSTINSNLLVSIGYFGGAVISVCISVASDQWKKRGVFCVATSAYCMIFAGVLESMTIGVTYKWTLFAMLTMLNSGVSLSQGINDTWLSVNCMEPFQRAIGLAVCVIGSNCGAILGQALFKGQDAPEYKPGFLGILVTYGAAMAWAMGQSLEYYWANKRLDKKEEVMSKKDQEDGAVDAANQDLTPAWRYHL